jgi:hypothetical protein
MREGEYVRDESPAALPPLTISGDFWQSWQFWQFSSLFPKSAPGGIISV